jgi:hypothetical protein
MAKQRGEGAHPVKSVVKLKIVTTSSSHALVELKCCAQKKKKKNSKIRSSHCYRHRGAGSRLLPVALGNKVRSAKTSTELKT